MRIYHSNTNTTTTSDPSVSPSVCLSITSTFSTVSFFCLSSIALSSAPCNPECCAIPAGSTGSHRHEPSYRGGKSVPPHHQPPQNYHRIKQCFMCYFSAMVMTAWWKINIGKWTFWSFTKLYTMVARGRSAPSVAGFINKLLFWTSSLESKSQSAAHLQTNSFYICSWIRYCFSVYSEVLWEI